MIQLSEVVVNINNDKTFVRFAEGNNYSIDSTSEIEALLFVNNTNSKITYKKEREYTDDLGYIHKVYQQYFNGYQVVGASYTVHSLKSELKYMNGLFVNVDNNLSFDFISNDDVLSIIHNSLDSAIRETAILNIEDLVICKDYIRNVDKYRIAYKILVFHLESLLHAYYYIDANTGQILAVSDFFYHANSNGVAQTHYSGTKNIVTDSSSGQYRLREQRQGVGIITLNKNNLSDVSTITELVHNSLL